MRLAFDWIEAYNRCDDTVICSDSLSLLTAIQSYSVDTQEFRDRTKNIIGRVILQWVPAHVNIPGNELADKAAKAAAKLPADLQQTAVPFSTAKAVIKRSICDPPPNHPRVLKAYQGLSQKQDNKLTASRKEQSLLAQLRAGHCLKLAHYRHRLDSTKSETCRHCKEDPETF